MSVGLEDTTARCNLCGAMFGVTVKMDVELKRIDPSTKEG